jgi:hypothetical protein
MSYNFGSNDYQLESEGAKRVVATSFTSPFVLD